MKIGVVSDTHNHLGNVERIVELFNGAGVDQVVHTGDITQAKTLKVFSKLVSPMTGVWGNNDQERESLERAATTFDFHFVEPPLTLDLAGRHITVVHDPLDLGDQIHATGDVVLHGHTHRREIVRKNGRLIFNPGECAGHMHGLNAIGVLDLTDLATEILIF
jgi:hypothetical protein